MCAARVRTLLCRAAVFSMNSMVVSIVGFSGVEWFTSQLPRENSNWQFKKLVRTFRVMQKKKPELGHCGEVVCRRTGSELVVCKSNGFDAN